MSMQFNTKEWHFYRSVAPKMDRHKHVLPSLFDFSRSLWEWNGKNFTFLLTKGRAAISGMCVWVIRILHKSLVHVFSSFSVVRVLGISLYIFLVRIKYSQ